MTILDFRVKGNLQMGSDRKSGRQPDKRVFQLIRIPEPREFRMMNCDFRMGNGTAKVLPDEPQHANGEARWLELIRIPGFGRYRKPTVGIGRLRNFRMTIFDFRLETESSLVGLGNCECRASNAEWGGSVGLGRYRTPKVGNGRFKIFEREMGYRTTKVLPDGLQHANGEVLDRIGTRGGSQQRLPAVRKNFLGRVIRVGLVEKGMDLERKLR
jgi:hypothetical protein